MVEKALHDNHIHLDFPFLAPDRRLVARLEKHDRDADLALLVLEDTAPAGSQPLRLVIEHNTTRLWGHSCRAFGFPQGHDGGTWATARLQDAIGEKGWLQFSASDASAYFVQAGFSGAPLWDEELNGVVGMIVAADRKVRAAFCIPTAQLLAFCPELRPQTLPPNPYRGLQAFREQHAAFFFGREAMSDELWKKVSKASLVSVLGASGSGKSSLVFAGLVPKVRAQPDWELVSLRPGDDPFKALARTLIPLLEPAMTETDRLREVPKLRDVLRHGEVILTDVLHRILDIIGKTTLLIVLDQFEELFTQNAASERSAFLELLLPVITLPGPCWRMLLTLRADFLSQALAHRTFADALNQGEKLFLAAMKHDELRDAICKPADVYNVTFEAGLVERILDDVEKAPGQLPLLEFTLTQMWERQEDYRLTHAIYDAIGGITGALTNYAEEVYARFTITEQEEVRRVFIQMVVPGEEGQDARRRVLRTELSEVRWNIVRQLADSRLLVTDKVHDGQEEYAELVHEVLIQGWPRLREWVDADRNFRRWQERARLLERQWREKTRTMGRCCVAHY